MTPEQRGNFEIAFTSGGSGCRRTCACGVEFYDTGNAGYSWEEGEFDALQADPKAIPLPYSVGTIIVEGTEFVRDCDCWKNRGEEMMRWMDRNAVQIAAYLTLEKRRLTELAKRFPTVE